MTGTVENQNRQLLSTTDLAPETLTALLEKSILLKRSPESDVLKGQTLALIFEKPSLRTRVSFELAMQELGGRALVLRPDEIQMGKREAVKDVAAYLSRNVTTAALRVFSHDTLAEFARYASIPVINALSDREHPCQALADLMTVLEHKQTLAGLRIAYLGDGNNVCHSLMLAAAMTGVSVTVACPPGYEPDEQVMAEANRIGEQCNAACTVVNDPDRAVADADVVYTDVWTSMGQETETETRKREFAGYQLNSERLALAPGAIVLHCLPAHRGDEITDAVIDGPQSVVFDQAENRRHAQKAVLLYVLDLL
jgi:ornithine carbamoyltransferase